MNDPPLARGTELGLFRALIPTAPVATNAAGAGPHAVEARRRDTSVTCPSDVCTYPRRLDSDPEVGHAVRRLLVVFSVFTCLAALGPDRSAAQVYVEANGNVGYTNVNPVEWLGQGAFDAEKFLYGADLAVVFGRRYGRGLQLALDFGYQHLLDYKFIQTGAPEDFTAEVYRGSLTTRFWFDEGAWFGEAGFGAYKFSNRTDPIITAGFGTLFEVGEKLALPVRARTAVVFGSTSQIVPVWLSAGVSYRIRS